jgi:hypothetical protein
MQRRSLLRTAGLASIAPLSFAAQTKPVSNASGRATIETSSRGNLFVRDWGAGRPVVFVHGRAVNCDVWHSKWRRCQGTLGALRTISAGMEGAMIAGISREQCAIICDTRNLCGNGRLDRLARNASVSQGSLPAIKRRH